MISGTMINVTRMDSKGRISIPFALRHSMRLSHGDELMLTMGSKELRLMPRGIGNLELKVKFRDRTNVSGALVSVMQVLAKHRADVINSEVQMHDGCAGWRAVVDADDFKKLKSEIACLKSIKAFSIKKNF